MGSRVRDFIEVRARASNDGMTGKSSDSRTDPEFGAAYHQSRVHVLEASMSGLVRLRVI
jgi:hypothetical protein